MPTSLATRRFALLPLILAIVLAGCAGGNDRKRHPSRPGKPVQTERSQMSDRELRQCFADLRAAEVKFEPLPDRHFSGGCSALDSVKLLDVGVPVSNLGALTCPLARTFSQWAYYAAMPAARRYFKTELVKIETMGSYACRNINGVSGPASNRRSEHAFANAVDVSAFILADGRRIAVKGGWSGGSSERQFLRAIHQSACKRFKTVLGPDYNAAHHDHLHLDMGRGPYCR